MDLFSNSGGHNHDTALLFDIGSGSVGIALAALSPDDSTTPEIIVSTRQQVPFQKEYDPERIIELSTEALKSSSQDLQELLAKSAAGVSVNGNIHCFFSSPWYISHTQTVDVKPTKPIKIDDEFLNGKLAEARNTLEQSNAEMFGDEPIEDLDTLEEELVNVSINGYPTNNPRGKVARECRLTTHTSLIPRDVKAAFADTLRDVFHTDEVTTHSFTFAATQVIKDTLNTATNNFVHIDISSELTEISLLKEGVLQESVSYPIGTHFIIRALTESFDFSKEEAVSRLRLVLDDLQNKDETEKVQAVIDEVKRRWATLFKKSLNELAHETSLSHQLFMTAPRPYDELFTGFIKENDYKEQLISQSDFAITVLDHEVLKDYITTPEKHAEFFDPFLALEALFVDNRQRNNY